MEVREITSKDKKQYNTLVTHPLQSWEWGEFREKTGLKVLRIGWFEKETLKQAIQMTLHPIPSTQFNVGYIPKGPLPTEEMLQTLKEMGKKYNCIFIKIEPNTLLLQAISYQLPAFLVPGKPLFTKYTFQLDLTQSEETLLKNMHSKTRYNIKVAQKYGVTVQEENTREAFATYWQLTLETTKRQAFYAHTQKYHQLMWETLHPTGMAHLFTARFNGHILTTWIVFLFNDVLYYPYGASTQEHKHVMASNLMMWEVIKWGKAKGAKLFDLWGTPGPDPKPTDPYYGFHRFKLGYGPKLVEFIGTYDLVLKPFPYQLFNIVDQLRWALLKIRAKI